jgi:tetratricopeptide (TPR) repeat protein
MQRILISIIGVVFAAGAAIGETCPEPSDHSVELGGLIADIQAAQSDAEANPISKRMWALWAAAPNEQAQAILDRGMARFAAFDYVGALSDFDTLIEYCSTYAEGYNQRAFVNFLRQDYAAALGDLDQAIDLSPNHIGALSGRALTLLGLQRTKEARKALQMALALNPWLAERGLAAPGGPLEPKGQDL